MKRLAGWETDLDEVLARWRLKPWDELTANCLLMVRDAALAMTGADPLAELGVTLEAVTTAVGRAALLERCGGTIGVMDAAFRIHVRRAFARKGDAVMLAEPGEDGERVFGVHDGQHAIYRTEQGTTVRPLSQIAIAWRIGL